MKKFLLAVAVLFFVHPFIGFGAGFAHAAKLSGKIYDPIKNDNKNLELVKVTLGNENPANSTDSDGDGFMLENFDPTIPSQTITFEKTGYIKKTGEITSENDEIFYQDKTTAAKISLGKFTVSIESDGPGELEGEQNPKTKMVVSPNTFTLPNIELLPNQKEIFAGKVYTTNPDGSDEQLAEDKDISISLRGKDSQYFVINDGSNKVNSDGSFSVKGYRFDEKEKYVLTFSGLPDYEDIEQEVNVKKEENKPENPLEIVFKKITVKKAVENNLTGITGFGCSELMPRYLVGADCVENSMKQQSLRS